MSGNDPPSAATASAMVEFVSTFPSLSGAPPETLADLSDGVALFEALSEVAPEYFDPTTIARHLGDNWALKSSNIRKLVRNLTSYFHEGLKKDADFETLDHSAIAKQMEEGQIAHLFELVAAAAVTCEQKSEYIGRIMQMSPDGQVEMKGVLERSLARLSDYYDSDAEGDEEETERDDENELVFDGDANGAGGAANSSLFGANHLKEDVEQELQEVRRELASYKTQAAVAAEDSEKAQQTLKTVVDDLQDRLVRRQDELIQVEEDLQKVQSELEDTKSKLAETLEEKTQLADDLDVANAKAQQLHKAEATLAAYKKRLEGAGVANQQMTEMEEQAASYLRQIMDLEVQVKKSNALQKSVVQLQEQVAKLEKEKENYDTSHKTSATEIADLKGKLTASERSKKVFEEELTELRAKLESAEEVPSPVHAVSSDDGASKELREKMMRMEIENQKLKEETENLQKGSAAAATAAAAGDSAAVAGLKGEVQRLQAELEVKQKENAKVCGEKDKLEAYTKRTLAKFQDKYLVALQECKAKLKEKQDKIEALENRNLSEKTAQKREERLLSSTIYELGMAIMQNRLKDR